MKTVTVTISTRPVGQGFGCCGVVRSARSGKSLAETRVFPHGHNANAYAAAEEIAKERGYRIAADDEQ